MIISGPLTAMLIELEKETDRIIAKHWEAEPTLKYHGPFAVSVTGIDGLIARFMEDGIDLYPEEEN